MKKAVIAGLILILIFAIIPLLAMQGNPKENTASNTPRAESGTASVKETTPAKEEKDTSPSSVQTLAQNAKDTNATFKIYDLSTKKIIEVSDREFCYGALAAEMDISYESEALKAQTVALYSYYNYLRTEQRKNPDKKLNGADFTCNCKIWKVYVPKSELKDKWSSTFKESYKIITEAVDSVFGTVAAYQNSAAKTMFFPMSSGMTETHKDIFKEDLPYLSAAASPFDMTSNNFTTLVKLDTDDFNQRAKEAWSGYKGSDNPNDVIGEIKRTDSGSVTEITLGGVTVSGQDVCDAFNLRSSNFELLYTQEQFIFTVKGYGHGVGMSQNGANEMAKQGSTYEEILNHYYKGTVLTANPNQ